MRLASVFCLLSSVLLLPAAPAAVATNAPPTVAVSVATNAPPAAIAPAWRVFSAKCAAKTATRADLIAFKRFIVASALDAVSKKTWTQRARKAYQDMKTLGSM